VACSESMWVSEAVQQPPVIELAVSIAEITPPPPRLQLQCWRIKKNAALLTA
jgi:hypothetical protein